MDEGLTFPYPSACFSSPFSFFTFLFFFLPPWTSSCFLGGFDGDALSFSRCDYRVSFFPLSSPPFFSRRHRPGSPGLGVDLYIRVDAFFVSPFLPFFCAAPLLCGDGGWPRASPFPCAMTDVVVLDSTAVLLPDLLFRNEPTFPLTFLCRPPNLVVFRTGAGLPERQLL